MAFRTYVYSDSILPTNIRALQGALSIEYGVLPSKYQFFSDPIALCCQAMHLGRHEGAMW